MMQRILFVVLLTITVTAFAQTPKVVTRENVTLTTTSTLTGYEVVIPDPARPETGSIGIRYSVVTKLGDTVLSTEQRAVAVTGAEPLTALVTDMSTRVATLMAARDPNAYYAGTRAALYAWLQANGHIEEDAQ